MQRKIDVAASDAARAAGNNAFKKGKWIESIGHYTTATVHNPKDPLAYCNRAQAYLKLDKWQDAERDCTTALELQNSNIKALYRRALARKGLKRYEEALEDLNACIRQEAANATVLEERDEVVRLLEAEKTRKRAPAIPTAAQRQKAAGATEPPDGLQPPSAAALVEPISKTTISPPSAGSEGQRHVPPPTESHSFADLRKARSTKLKTFTSGSAAAPANPTSASTRTTPEPKAEATLQSSKAVVGSFSRGQATLDLSSTAEAQWQRTTPASTSRDPAKAALTSRTEMPTGPRISANGMGVQLIRKLTGLPEEDWIELRRYEPRSLVPALQNLLEPDTMGKLLLALRFGAAQGQHDDVRTAMQDLRRIPRFSMNLAMLSKDERNAALEAWDLCGTGGAWL